MQGGDLLPHQGLDANAMIWSPAHAYERGELLFNTSGSIPARGLLSKEMVGAFSRVVLESFIKAPGPSGNAKRTCTAGGETKLVEDP